MTDANPLVAEILETSVDGYASAANTLLQQLPQELPSSERSASQWKAHLTQQILELAAAVRINQPSIFVRRVGWLRSAIASRGENEAQLRSALESLRTALEQELPDSFKAAVRTPIQLALDSLDAEIEPQVQTLDASTPNGMLSLRYLTACLEARADAATKLVLNALDGGLAPQDAYTKVLLPAEREVGRLWHLGDLSVAEERLVTETTREVMTLIVNRCAPDPDRSRVVVAASVAGNAHDVGLRAAADLFKLAGWHTIFLGANMPTAEIAEAAEAYEAKLIVLSATLNTQLKALGAAIQGVKLAAPAAKVLVGGLALEGSPDLWKQLGADAYASDLDSLLSTGSALISGS